jgi:hypothetical protein
VTYRRHYAGTNRPEGLTVPGPNWDTELSTVFIIACTVTDVESDFLIF